MFFFLCFSTLKVIHYTSNILLIFNVSFKHVLRIITNRSPVMFIAAPSVYAVHQLLIQNLGREVRFRDNVNNSSVCVPVSGYVCTWLGCVLSCMRLLVAPWTVALQAPLSMEFSGHEYSSGFAISFQGNLPNPRVEPTSPALAGGFFTTEPPREPNNSSTVPKWPCALPTNRKINS